MAQKFDRRGYDLRKVNNSDVTEECQFKVSKRSEAFEN
jgi:hypothetical protein